MTIKHGFLGLVGHCGALNPPARANQSTVIPPTLLPQLSRDPSSSSSYHLHGLSPCSGSFVAPARVFLLFRFQEKKESVSPPLLMAVIPHFFLLPSTERSVHTWQTMRSIDARQRRSTYIVVCITVHACKASEKGKNIST